jgi:hypothetical protein
MEKVLISSADGVGTLMRHRNKIFRWVTGHWVEIPLPIGPPENRFDRYSSRITQVVDLDDSWLVAGAFQCRLLKDFSHGWWIADDSDSTFGFATLEDRWVGVGPDNVYSLVSLGFESDDHRIRDPIPNGHGWFDCFHQFLIEKPQRFVTQEPYDFNIQLWEAQSPNESHVELDFSTGPVLIGESSLPCFAGLPAIHEKGDELWVFSRDQMLDRDYSYCLFGADGRLVRQGSYNGLPGAGVGDSSVKIGNLLFASFGTALYVLDLSGVDDVPEFTFWRDLGKEIAGLVPGPFPEQVEVFSWTDKELPDAVTLELP